MSLPLPRRAASLLSVLALAALAGGAVSASASERRAQQLPDRWIVVYEDSVRSVDRATDNRERAQGFRSRYRYGSALKGFAARLSPGQVRALRKDPKVDYVAPDRPVRVAGDLVAGDSAPNGLRRMEAATETITHNASGAGVAVIDTGIDLAHPDLRANSVSGKNCIDSSKSAQDDHGHGTHVAGTIGAANDGTGVVGVAPGTTMYAVKVLDRRGSGSTSSVVCGINWVTANADKVTVANMSLGGAGDPVKTCATTTDPQHDAICKSTAGGVVYAVAAGNSGWDFDYAPQPDVPAAYPQVITVSAMADTDGASGALGTSCSKEYDDRYAGFSNYAATTAGAAHTLAAPGVCVVSDQLAGGTTSMSGTSMASPHVAGAVALCINEKAADGTPTAGTCAGLAADNPGAFIAELTKNSADTAYGFHGDPDTSSTFAAGGRYYGFLGWSPIATAEPQPQPTDTTAPAAPSGLAAIAGDARVSLEWNDNSETDLAGYNVYRRTDGTTYGDPIATGVTTSAYVDSTAANGTVYHYVVRAVDKTGNVSGASNEASATPTATATTSIELTATSWKHKGSKYVGLTWNTDSTGPFDVYRDGTKIATTTTTSYTDSLGKGGGTYRYKVCVAGTETCSNEATVSF